MTKEYKDPIEKMELKIMQKLFNSFKFPEEAKISAMEFVSLRRELTKESDRGCALLAASYLDYLLELLLRKKLLGSKSLKDEIFSPNGPLGLFSARIKLAYSIGLIEKKVFQDLQSIRKIRNEFGHNPKILSFENAKIKVLSQQLLFNVLSKNRSSRLKFISSVSSISGILEGSRYAKKPFQEAKETDLYKSNALSSKMLGMILEELNKKAKNKVI